MPTFWHFGGTRGRSQSGLTAPGRPSAQNEFYVHPTGMSALRRGASIREFSERGPMQAFRANRVQAAWIISGRTLDSGGTPLAGCEVEVFYEGSDVVVAKTISDGSGNWSVTVSTNSPMYARATDANETVCGCTTLLTPTQV